VPSTVIPVVLEPANTATAAGRILPSVPVTVENYEAVRAMSSKYLELAKRSIVFAPTQALVEYLRTQGGRQAVRQNLAFATAHN